MEALQPEGEPMTKLDMSQFDLAPIKRKSDYWNHAQTKREICLNALTDKWETATQIGRRCATKASSIGNALRDAGPDEVEKMMSETAQHLLYRKPQGEA